LLKWHEQPAQILRTGTGSLSSYATHNTRTPGGHPEGYLEAFGNLYRNFAIVLSSTMEGTKPPIEALDYPSVEEGVRGMAFIEMVVKSSASNEKWTNFEV
jgi:hypothetical protein